MKKIVWFLFLVSMTAFLSGCFDGDSDGTNGGASDKVSDVLSTDERTLFSSEELAVIDAMAGEEIVVAANAELDSANTDGDITQDELERVNAYYKMAAEKTDEGKVLYSISSVATAADLVANVTSVRTSTSKTAYIPYESHAVNYIKGSLVDSYYNDVTEDINASLAMLAQIDSSFDSEMTFGKTTYDVDYGDVLTLKAALEAAKISVAYAYAYNIKSETNYLYFRDFLFENDNFLTANEEAETVLASQKEGALAMLKNFRDANEYIRAETDSQADDLVVLNPNDDTDVDSIYEGVSDSVKDVADYTSGHFTYDFAKLFTPLSLRSYVMWSTEDESLDGFMTASEDDLRSVHNGIDKLLNVSIR